MRTSVAKRITFFLSQIWMLKTKRDVKKKIEMNTLQDILLYAQLQLVIKVISEKSVSSLNPVVSGIICCCFLNSNSISKQIYDSLMMCKCI